MEHRIFQGLNDKQIEAVKVTDGPVLVISGPGSGKTRCLTHRIAYLIASGIPPHAILAVTFTNKAASEMRDRISELLKDTPTRSEHMPHIGTFHALCVRILRRHIELLGYGPQFTIADTDDQLTLIRRIMTDLELDIKRFHPRSVLSKISELKTSLIFPHAYRGEDFYTKIVSRVYERYQSALHQANMLDFDDLIALTVRLFTEHPAVLETYHSYWHYILVDEYQDTSHDQYTLIQLLAQKKRNIFCIGDDAQSIYQFRKADIRNILHFQKDYPDARIIMLEQNYRSTDTIITAAQHIISNNKAQIPKKLWTENEDGGKIVALEALNEREEAIRIVEKIGELSTKKIDLHDMAILYRTHAQSRTIEEALIMKNIPYQIVGGIKFYERKEIKDLVAYLKLVANPSDGVSFERIYNVPARGIGKTTFQKIISLDEPHVIRALQGVTDKEKLSTKTAHHITHLCTLLTDFQEAQKTLPLSKLIQHIVRELRYEDYLRELSFTKTGDFENFEDRLENIKELLTVAKKYDRIPDGQGLSQFLEEVTLLQETDRTKTSAHNRSRITLMTIHASKGLEFPAIFVMGMEEGLFPHSRTLINPVELEEERRLCYVAITRAKKYLILTFARYRNIYGSTGNTIPSRFIGEIPSHLIEYQLASDTERDYEEKIFY